MDEKEIESLQLQIDELNALFDQIAEPAGTEDLGQEDLGTLFLKYQDGDLSQEEYENFQKQLLNDSKALNEYINLANLSALLHLHYHPEFAEQALTSLQTS